MKMKKAIEIGLLFAALTCGGAGVANADLINGRDADALSPQAVAQNYAGKAWYWKTGAAYFAPNGSCQIILCESRPARVNKSRSCTWAAHEYGVLTLEVFWRSTPSRGYFDPNEWRHSRSSFAHERDEAGNIFQRKDECPSGDIPWEGWSWDHETSCAAHTSGQWYVFKHATPAKHDEWWKVQSGNATAQVMRWKM